MNMTSRRVCREPGAMLGSAACFAVLTLLACGGNDAPKGKFAASSTIAAKCAAPRSGIDPSTGRAFPDTRGSLDDEKAWLRSWNDELYLWYREVPQTVLDAPGAYATPIEYFDALKTPLQVAGRPKDQFHFFIPTDAWEQLSQSGVQAGYGVQWALLASRPPRRAIAVYTEPGSPADDQLVLRGAEVLSVDGVDLANGTDVNALNEGLFPTVLGVPHTIELRDVGAATSHTVTLVSENVTSVPVQKTQSITTGTAKIGYMLFNDHVATAEKALIAAVNQLKADAVTDLVLDIRYNGGGFLDIASELAFMIAGPDRTTGKTFEKTTFSDKYPTNDPVTGRALAPTPFHATTQNLSVAAGQPLPHLDLPRVFVLTGSGTCSASESIINSLQGVDVEVIQIGTPTCGKPYGFYPQDNCGTTYFSIEFEGVNAKGFGDYANGFEPGGTGAASPPGCAVPDDFAHQLGDPAEARLAAALQYRLDGTCPPPAAALARGLSVKPADVVVPKGPWRENRIMRR
jgi:carboxyl-terminal processing protease